MKGAVKSADAADKDVQRAKLKREELVKSVATMTREQLQRAASEQASRSGKGHRYNKSIDYIKIINDHADISQPAVVEKYVAEVDQSNPRRRRTKSETRTRKSPQVPQASPGGASGQDHTQQAVEKGKGKGKGKATTKGDGKGKKGKGKSNGKGKNTSKAGGYQKNDSALPGTNWQKNKPKAKSQARSRTWQ